ncbi:MAG: hypothetical protein OXS32_04405 [Verrucomicrobiales bacterium]|nr:hypothetical protein [Verrucomicrobiales bacterium]
MLLTVWLLLCGLSASAQVPLELESETIFFVAPDGLSLLTRSEYEARYERDNSFQAANAVTVKVQHFNKSVTVSDLRKKASADVRPKSKGPVVHVSISFVRQVFDTNFLSFAETDRVAIRRILAKFKEWVMASSGSKSGTQLRRPFPGDMAWPVTASANDVVTLSELPLIFMRGADGKPFLMFAKDKDFPSGMEVVASAVGGQEGEAGGGTAKSNSVVLDHWMNVGESALFEAVLQKVDAILKENLADIQKLN